MAQNLENNYKTATELDILPELVGYNLRRTQIAYYQDYVKTFDKPRVSPTQFSILVLVDSNPGISQTEIGRTLGMARAATMVIIDKLENRNWLTRRKSQADKRMHALELTASGRLLLKQLRKKVLSFDAENTAALTKSEKKQLIKLLQKLRGLGN